MAHGFGNHLKSDKYKFYSAGTKKHEVYRRVRSEIRAFVENIEEYAGVEND
jgi:protein-tyrosine-phosphatase